MTAEGATREDLADGQTIRWANSYGVSGEAHIFKLKGFIDSDRGAVVSFYSDHYKSRGKLIGAFERFVLLEHITHIGRRRVRRETSRHADRIGLSSSSTTAASESHQTVLSTGNKEERDMVKKLKAMQSRKGLDEMSESHRAHVERWDPHCAKMRAQFVWIGVQRFSQRGVEGPHYVAVKRDDKDYAILDYDTSKLEVKSYRLKVVEDGFETSSAMMEAFKVWRATAREERAASKSKPTKGGAKPKAKTRAKPKAKKAPAKKAAAKKPPTRKRAPARAKKS